MIKLIAALASAFVLSASIVSAQTAPPSPDKTKPPVTTEQPAKPPTTQQAAPAKPAALVTLKFAQATGPKCTDVETPQVADTVNSKLVKVTRPRTGAPIGATIGLNVPGNLGLDRVDANKQFVKGLQTCDGGMSFALKAIVVEVTPTTEGVVIMVPETLKTAFQARSCSPHKNHECAWGEFAGFDKPLTLGAFGPVIMARQ